MKTDIQQNNLIIAGITIPLLAAANMDMKVTVPYTFHNPYIYHVSQRDEARLLRRILIHGLLPTYRVCKKRWWMIIRIKRLIILYTYRNSGKFFCKVTDVLCQMGQ